MRIAVTGGTGHVGGNLVRALLRRGDRVRAMVRSDVRALEGLDVERLPGDLLDPGKVRELVDGAEVVYHLAARISIAAGDEEEVQRCNVLGTRNVAAACRDAGVSRLVHFSSVHALKGWPRDVVVDETSPSADLDEALPYDRSKAQGEKEVLEAVRGGLDAVIVNPTAVVGPFDFRPSPFGEAMLGMYHRTLPGLVRGGFDWVDVRDVVDAALAAEGRGRTGERYLVTGHWAELRDVSRTIAEVTGHPTVSWASPHWLARLGAPGVTAWCRMTGRRPLYTSQSLRMVQEHRHVSRARAEAELGYRPRPLRETLEATFAWFREAGMLDAAPQGGTAGSDASGAGRGAS
ncbi:NAD-dependent epimerase/dehydratase family protein [Myxococcota bacterium]|nr:NAD-dependent epimerase/dehydratase family protein [Myxococcota bacterium]